MFALVPAAALTLALLPGACGVAAMSPAAPVDVVRVTDGDTVKVSTGETIRIRGVDTPETKKPGTPVQCGGPEATEFAKRTLLGKHVTLLTDPGDLYDRYGRTVAEVRLPSGESYALLAVREGVGRAYLYNRKHPASDWPAIQAAETDARAAHRGLWGHCPVG